MAITQGIERVSLFKAVSSIHYVAMNPPSPYVTALELAAVTARLNADHLALLSVAVSIAEHVGLQDLDGVPVHQWYEQKRVSFLEKRLIEVEDSDPSLAALLQEIIDHWKQPPR